MPTILIRPVSTTTRTFDAIVLLLGDLHFSCDLVNDRQIRLAQRLSDDLGADWNVHPDLQPRVDAALSAKEQARSVTAAATDAAHSARLELFQLGNRVAGEEFDDDDAEHIGARIIELAGVCPSCRGSGQDGDTPDANGEGGWSGACDDCGGQGVVSSPLFGAPRSFQQRVSEWLLACFGDVIAGDREERNFRFLEESVELVQSCGCTREDAHKLVDYVFDRPVGEREQEVGGVSLTLAALCSAQGIDLYTCSEEELARVWQNMARIRAKQAAKPIRSPLPGQCEPTTATDIAL